MGIVNKKSSMFRDNTGFLYYVEQHKGWTNYITYV